MTGEYCKMSFMIGAARTWLARKCPLMLDEEAGDRRLRHVKPKVVLDVSFPMDEGPLFGRRGLAH
jgi:hypothetical protein